MSSHYWGLGTTWDTVIFDINYDEYRSRRATALWQLIPVLNGDVHLTWFTVQLINPVVEPGSPYLGKIKVATMPYYYVGDPVWRMAYFEWDAL